MVTQLIGTFVAVAVVINTYAHYAYVPLPHAAAGKSKKPL